MKTQILIIGFAILALTIFGTTIITGAPTLRTNGKIAFTGDRDGNREIYVINEDGSNFMSRTNQQNIVCPEDQGAFALSPHICKSPQLSDEFRNFAIFFARLQMLNIFA